jgi:hypothetical protein
MNLDGLVLFWQVSALPRAAVTDRIELPVTVVLYFGEVQ